MSVEDINRFTKDDVVCALEMFNEDYVTFPRDDIAKISGMTMPVNKRNWRKQKDHLGRARAVQNFDDPDGNGEIRKGSQRHRTRFMNGGSSTRKDARRTATEIPGLIRRRSVSGGTASRLRCGRRMVTW